MVSAQDRLRRVLEGGLGFFWSVSDATLPDLENTEPERGFVRELEGELQLQVLREDITHVSGKPTVPPAYVGATQHSGVLLTDISRAVRGMNIGGGQASVSTYTAQTIAAGPTILECDALGIVEVAVVFHGIGAAQWAGVDPLEQSTKLDDRNRIESHEIRLKPTQDLGVRLSPTSSLRLSAYWNTGSTKGTGIKADIGLKATVTSRDPRPLKYFIGRLRHVQDLMGLAFGGHYPCAEGFVQLEGAMTADALWNAGLMRAAPRGDGADSDSRPLFPLAECGGVEGVRRWFHLNETSTRAVSPIVSGQRHGVGGPETRLLEIATAIEYWVAKHRRSAKWSKRGHNYAGAVALHVGAAFKEWVGDARIWAEVFWECYTGLKHIPTYRPPRREVALLALSAERLMAAELLNRIAGRKKPGRSLLSDYRTWQLGEELRELIGGAWSKADAAIRPQRD